MRKTAGESSESISGDEDCLESGYKGFCFDKQGRYTPGVTLSDVSDVIWYCKLQGLLHYEVRITDSTEDSIVMQVINGFVIWPEQLKGIHVNGLVIDQCAQGR